MKNAFTRALLSTVFVSAGALAASAADLPSHKGPAVAPLPVFATWDGSYFGVNAGYGWTQNNTINTAGAPGFSQIASSGLVAATLATSAIQVGNGGGFAGGAQAGYNKQYGSFVFGWESDIQGFASSTKQAGAFGAAFDNGPPATLTSITGVSKKINWLATSRVRAGFLVVPNVMLYATGGVASGGVSASTGITQAYNPAANQGGPFVAGSGAGSYSSTRVGYTIGGGGEWMFAPRWSVKAEYLYYDLGRAAYGVTPATNTQVLMAGTTSTLNQAFGSSSVRFNGHLARVGLSYHWDWTSLAPAPAPSPQYAVWNGFYAGLNAGYGWTQNSGVPTVAAPGASNAINSLSLPVTAAALGSFTLPGVSSGGFTGGGQAGLNHQFGSFVFGWETDIQAFGSNKSHASGVSALADPSGAILSQTASVSRQIDWLSTSRWRVGFLVTPSVLLYGTGGFATGGIKASTTITQTAQMAQAATMPVPGFGSYSQTRAGYTLGGGAEWAFAGAWSVKAEYLYYDLGRANYAISPAGIAFAAAPNHALSQAIPMSSTRFNGQVVHAGVNYHFNWDPAPVVAAKY